MATDVAVQGGRMLRNNRKTEIEAEMEDIEKGFIDVKRKLLKARLKEVNDLLEEVNAGTLMEVKRAEAMILEEGNQDYDVAAKMRDLQMHNIQQVYQFERQSALNNYKEHATLMKREKIHNLRIRKLKIVRKKQEMDQLPSADHTRRSLTSKLPPPIWGGSDARSFVSQRGPHAPTVPRVPTIGTKLVPLKRRKQPVKHSGVYIIYMLPDDDIQDDLNLMRRATAAATTTQPASDGVGQVPTAVPAATL